MFSKEQVNKTMKDEMTGPSWDRYRLLKEEHDREWEAKKPRVCNYNSYEEYQKALDKWAMYSSLSAPNKPGYEYANNH